MVPDIYYGTNRDRDNIVGRHSVFGIELGH